MGKAQAYARKAGSARLLHEAIAATGRMLFWAGRPAEAVPWLQRAVGFFGDHDFYRHAAVSDLANTFQTLGRAHDAIPLYLELLEIAEELDWPFGMSGVLRSLGEIAAQKGNPRRAVRLAAVGCALACRGPAGPDGSGLPWLKTIDPAIVNEEWPAGAAMSVDEALSYARSEV
jgi:tetratricopeptide (TPR) repeat protein